MGRARSKRDALGPALAANDRRALSRGGAEATQIRPAAARAVHVRAALRQVPTRPNVPSPCATSHNVRSALHALHRIRFSSAKQYGTVLYSIATCTVVVQSSDEGMRRSTGRAGAVGMWAWVDDLTPLVARSRFRRYTYTRSPMRDDPGDRLVLVVQERVTLETSAVVRCAGPEWLLARAASRGACRERESRWSRRCPDPNRSRARKPSRRAATHSRLRSRNRSNDNARSACEVRNGSSTGRFRTYP
jgi:hypothetical protein